MTEWLGPLRPDPRGRLSGAPWIKGISKKIGAIAFPLEGQGARLLGAVGIFWEESCREGGR